MAVTSVPTNARIVTWQRDFFREYVRANRFSKYMGSDETSIIQVNEDLTKKVGETINFTLVNRLVGNLNTNTGSASSVISGVTGYNRLKGNEESLSIRNWRLTVNRTRWAVLNDVLDDQFSAIDLAEAKRATIMDWQKENIRDRIISALGSISTDGTTHVAYADATAGNKNTWSVNNSDRIIFGATTGNYSGVHATDLQNVDTTADTFTGANLKALKDVAKAANPKIRPIKVNDEEEYYVVFTGTALFRQLQADLATTTLARLYNEDYKSNPIFSSGDLMYDGMIIREIPEIAGLGTVGASSAKVMRAFLCGAQALGYGVAQRTKMISDVDDYGALAGVGTQMIDGIAKAYFGSGSSDTTTPKQNGVAIGYYAYS